MLKRSIIAATLLVTALLFLSASCDKNTTLLDETSGYDWQPQQRDYWPTENWQTAPMTAHGVDPDKMEQAFEFAQNDDLSRALLVVKNGYIVYEAYFDDGGIDKSTNLWSVTKSVSSALTGIYLDENPTVSTSDLMADLLPAYPEFGSITLHHVLTMTTGLNWAEEGPLWVQWILSDDWVYEALSRGHFDAPGAAFKYSSGNTHFLTSMLHYRNGIDIGVFVKKKLFDPMGIPFYPEPDAKQYVNWNQYTEPYDQSWRKDSNDIETASFGLYLTARDMAKFGFLYLNKGRWENKQLISSFWVDASTQEHVKNIYGRYSYGYQWYITLVDGYPAFLASGYGGQLIGIVPAKDLVVVLKYEAEHPEHPVSGSDHDDMKLFELIVNSVD